jgi:hypothetical protein
MSMISHDRFGTLRLAQFIPNVELAELENWEFMGQLWVGEALGFSEWLRLEYEPDALRSLAIDFPEFPEQAAIDVLRTIDLQVRPGMKLGELHQILGRPVKELHFPRVDDRVTYEFATPSSPGYDVSCTVLNEGGLTYLIVMTPMPPGRG